MPDHLPNFFMFGGVNLIWKSKKQILHFAYPMDGVHGAQTLRSG